MQNSFSEGLGIDKTVSQKFVTLSRNNHAVPLFDTLGRTLDPMYLHTMYLSIV